MYLGGNRRWVPLIVLQLLYVTNALFISLLCLQILRKINPCWATRVDRKWGLSFFNMPWNFQICIAVSLYSYTDNFSRKSGKNYFPRMQKSTYGWHTSLKNVRGNFNLVSRVLSNSSRGARGGWGRFNHVASSFKVVPEYVSPSNYICSSTATRVCQPTLSHQHWLQSVIRTSTVGVVSVPISWGTISSMDQNQSKKEWKNYWQISSSQGLIYLLKTIFLINASVLLSLFTATTTFKDATTLLRGSARDRSAEKPAKLWFSSIAEKSSQEHVK